MTNVMCDSVGTGYELYVLGAFVGFGSEGD